MPNKLITQDELAHFGILGMKWGVRRYQREDGTRTQAGKQKEAQERNSKSDDHVTSRVNRQNGISTLSNSELRQLNERLQLESTYRTLTAPQVNQGKSFVQKAVTAGASAALTEFSKGIALGAAKTLIRNLAPTFAAAAFPQNEKKKS